MSTVNTKKVSDRRSLRFGRMSDLIDDVSAFEGNIQASGNWTPAQIVEHVTKLIQCSLDGFEVPNAPLIVRGIVKMMRSSVLNKPMKPGVKLPGNFKFLVPSDDVTWAQATGHLKKVVDRIEKGERMKQRSPVLGFLEHEEWIQLHCRHSEMHFSFLQPVEKTPEASTESNSE
ncbi:MAG: DUF1569 domain-containing protein [Planctomycetota bacterium]|nr:DUF1569 domain-containing protein [Planctomycetota bacterium]